MEEILPEYLSIGVSYERFMDSCPVDLEPFEAAQRKKLNSENSMMYLQGMYVRDAILCSIGNSQWFKDKSQAPYKYPDEPYELFPSEKGPENDDKGKERDLQKFIAQENIRRANWRMTHAKQKEEQ